MMYCSIRRLNRPRLGRTLAHLSKRVNDAALSGQSGFFDTIRYGVILEDDMLSLDEFGHEQSGVLHEHRNFPIAYSGTRRRCGLRPAGRG